MPEKRKHLRRNTHVTQTGGTRRRSRQNHRQLENARPTRVRVRGGGGVADNRAASIGEKNESRTEELSCEQVASKVPNARSELVQTRTCVLKPSRCRTFNPSTTVNTTPIGNKRQMASTTMACVSYNAPVSLDRTVRKSNHYSTPPRAHNAPSPPQNPSHPSPLKRLHSRTQIRFNFTSRTPSLPKTY